MTISFARTKFIVNIVFLKRIFPFLWDISSSHEPPRSNVQTFSCWVDNSLRVQGVIYTTFHYWTVFSSGDCFHRDCLGRDCFFWDCFSLGLFFSGTVFFWDCFGRDCFFLGLFLFGTVFFWDCFGPDCFIRDCYFLGLIWSGLLAEGLILSGLFWWPAQKIPWFLLFDNWHN